MEQEIVPIQVTCPSCQGMFNAPDGAGGKRAKCPTCGGAIQIPAQPAPVPVPAYAAAEQANAYDDDFAVEAPVSLPSEEERKQCPMCGEMIAVRAIKCRYCGEILDESMRGMIRGAADVHDPGWRRVRSGLATMYYCTVAMIVTAILVGALAAIGFAVAGGPGGNDPPVIALVALGIGGLTFVGLGIGVLVGECLCIGVPEASGARGFIVGAVVCVAANFILAFVGALLPPLGLLGNIASIVGWVLFVLFLRQCALYFGDQHLAQSATRFMIFAVVAFVSAIALGIMAGISGEEVVIGLLAICAIVCFLVYIVWYLRLIKSLITTIDQRTAAS